MQLSSHLYELKVMVCIRGDLCDVDEPVCSDGGEGIEEGHAFCALALADEEEHAHASPAGWADGECGVGANKPGRGCYGEGRGGNVPLYERDELDAGRLCDIFCQYDRLAVWCQAEQFGDRAIRAAGDLVACDGVDLYDMIAVLVDEGHFGADEDVCAGLVDGDGSCRDGGLRNGDDVRWVTCSEGCDGEVERGGIGIGVEGDCAMMLNGVEEDAAFVGCRVDKGDCAADRDGDTRVRSAGVDGAFAGAFELFDSVDSDDEVEGSVDECNEHAGKCGEDGLDGLLEDGDEGRVRGAVEAGDDEALGAGVCGVEEEAFPDCRRVGGWRRGVEQHLCYAVFWARTTEIAASGRPLRSF
jgi:hypothetical protein